MTRGACTVSGCVEVHHARGLCNAHYLAQRAGRPLVVRAVPIGKTYERFWDNLVPTERGCREWRTRVGTNHYGYLAVDGKTRSAHRVAWELAHGRPVPAGLCVLHHCDNRPCCNPEHLYVGTVVDNGRDAATRLRARMKLTPDDVIALRKRYADGATCYALAKAFDVSTSQVERIVRGERRGHVPTTRDAVTTVAVRAKVPGSWAYRPTCPLCSWGDGEVPSHPRSVAVARARAHMQAAHPGPPDGRYEGCE